MVPIRPNPARAERRCRQPGIRIIEIGRILHDQMDLQRQLPLSPGEGGDDSSAYAYEVRIQAASLSALEISLIVGFFALAHGERDDAPVGETDATSRLSSRQHRRRELERRSGRVSRYSEQSRAAAEVTDPLPSLERSVKLKTPPYPFMPSPTFAHSSA